MIAEIERRTQEVENIISSTPGFVAYHAVKSGDTLISLHRLPGPKGRR
jgi:hypothetical protein